MHTLMKKLLFFIFLLSIIGCTNKKSSLNMNGIRGKVKSILVRNYSPIEKFGEWTKDFEYENSSNYQEFDKDGNSIQRTNYFTGDVINTKSISILKDGLIMEADNYNKDGSRMEVEKYLWKSDTLREMKKYDNDGNVKYQSNDYFNKEGEFYRSDWTLYNYLEPYNPASDSIVGMIDTLGMTFTENELELFKRTGIFPQKSSEKKIEAKPIPRNITGKSSLFFNSDGYLIKSKGSDSRPKEFELTFKYIEFDSNSNWTKALIYNSKNIEKPVQLSYRTITYW